MSLINEALRKARLEAARQDAAQRGLGYPGVQAPRRSKRVVLAAVGLLALAMLGASLYWLGMRAARNSASPQTAAAGAPDAGSELPNPPPPAAPGTAAEPATERTPTVDPSPAPQPGPGPREIRETEPARSARRSDPQVTRGPTPRVADEPTAREAAAPAAPAEIRPAETTDRPEAPAARRVAEAQPETSAHATGPEVTAETATEPPEPTPSVDPEPASGRTGPEAAAAVSETFVREAAIPGVGNLRLGGIAWSERQPYALINGRVVGPGDRIQGLQVSAVERTQVKLRDAGGATYVLRIR